MAKDAKKAPKKPKGKAPASSRSADDDARIVRINAHPRARRHIAQAKGWGGLVGFGLVLWLSLRAGVPAFESGVRALAGGIVLYVAAWTLAVAVWRQIAVAEVHAARRRLEEENARRTEEIAAAAAAAAEDAAQSATAALPA